MLPGMVLVDGEAGLFVGDGNGGTGRHEKRGGKRKTAGLPPAGIEDLFAGFEHGPRPLTEFEIRFADLPPRLGPV